MLNMGINTDITLQIDGVVNAFKVERINRVLKSLYDFVKDEPYISHLEIVPEPTEEKGG